jgi:hypothetical protein
MKNHKKKQTKSKKMGELPMQFNGLNTNNTLRKYEQTVRNEINKCPNRHIKRWNCDNHLGLYFQENNYVQHKI